jgi:hypothetical protein
MNTCMSYAEEDAYMSYAEENGLQTCVICVDFCGSYRQGAEDRALDREKRMLNNVIPLRISLMHHLEATFENVRLPDAV